MDRIIFRRIILKKIKQKSTSDTHGRVTEQYSNFYFGYEDKFLAASKENSIKCQEKGKKRCIFFVLDTIKLD